MKTTIRLALLAALTLSLGACAHTQHIGDLQAHPSTLMTAKKIQRPLYVVIDPAKVPDKLQVKHSKWKVDGFRKFFETSLKNTLGPMFDKVIFVEPGFKAPHAPFLVADAKINPEIVRRHVGWNSLAVVHMQWGFALRPAEADDYLFSYAGERKNTMWFSHFNAGMKELMHGALNDFLSSYADKKIQQELKKIDRSDSQPAPHKKADNPV